MGAAKTIGATGKIAQNTAKYGSQVAANLAAQKAVDTVKQKSDINTFVGPGGDKRIGALQQAIGLVGAQIDGKMGPNTAKALMAWQQSNKLPVTGKADPATMSKAGIAENRVHTVAEDIRSMQQKLAMIESGQWSLEEDTVYRVWLRPDNTVIDDNGVLITDDELLENIQWDPKFLAEQEQLDELSLAGAGKGLGKALGAVAGGVVQGAKNIYQGAKQGYAAGKAALAPEDDPTTAQQTPTTGSQGVTQQTSTASSQSVPQPTATNTATDTEVDQILQIVSKMDPNTKKEVISKIQAQPTAAPQGQQQAQGQAVDLDQLKQQSAAQKAQGQANQQQAQQQMQQTQQANAANSQKDNALVAAVKAEKAKPGFQQDKGLLARAAAQGIHENKKKKKKAVMEFHSKFLGCMI
jgi:hypothetical protein